MNTQLRDQDISLLIAQYRLGLLSSEESMKLDQWIAEDASRKELLEDTEGLSQMIHDLEKIDPIQSFNKIQRRRQRRYAIKLMRYAAVMIPFVVGVALFMILGKGETQRDHVVVAYNDVAVDAPQLITSGGESVSLTATKQDVDLGNNYTAQLNEGKLTYKAGTSKTNVEFNTLIVPKGQEFQLTLSDGTLVTLNSNTVLKYPVQFSGNKREIYLEGEAYFNVKRNEKMPFEVITAYGRTQVLGTEFNVKAYSGDDIEAVTLVSGKVCVKNKVHNEQYLLPGQQCKVDSLGAMSYREVDVSNYIAWRMGIFAFDNQPLVDVMEEIKRWYDIDVDYVCNQTKEVRISAKIRKKQNYREVLDLIEMTGNIAFVCEDNHVKIIKKK